MGIVGAKVEKKTKTESVPGIKKQLRDLSFILDAIEFAEGRNDEKLKAAYEKEAVTMLLAIKKAYGPRLESLVS